MLPVNPPGLDVTVYLVIAEPFDAGTVHVTVAFAFPAVAVPIIGAPGTPDIIEFDAAEAAPVPTAFVAVTVNV